MASYFSLIKRSKGEQITNMIIINPSDYCITGNKEIKLKKWPTIEDPFYKSKDHYKELLATNVRELSELQRLLYASNSYSVLMIFQAMDAAGKDGAISNVLSGINPQGCSVYSFKQPSAEELEHDFLWRTNIRLPERGRIGVFNRSYYEEVLVVRVHPEFLSAQGITAEAQDKKSFWKERYDSIVNMEKHLYRNGTRILKFFLHLSKDEQRKRLLARIDEPDKNWKFNAGDLKERALWDHYMSAYEDCLASTATKSAPWYVVPADDKYNARLIISRIAIETLQGLKMSYPELNAAQKEELKTIRQALTSSFC
jgi:PPK2 family polyphosphate:nucleotide phosphotransferase